MIQVRNLHRTFWLQLQKIGAIFDPFSDSKATVNFGGIVSRDISRAFVLKAYLTDELGLLLKTQRERFV